MEGESSTKLVNEVADEGGRRSKDADEGGRRAKKAKRDVGSTSATAGSTSAAAASVTATAAAVPAQVPAAAVTSECAAATEEANPHLCCSVCFSFPEGNVLQCGSGHIMCCDCHTRVCAEDKPTCPTCRVSLDPLKPIRNVLAEQTIALLPVACPNDLCNAKCTRGSLQSHLTTECAFRQTCCKYAPLGCKWTGLARQLQRHEDRCKKAELPGWKLLKKVEGVQANVATAAARETIKAAADAKIVGMLTSRCRNLEISHVTLHKCSAHEHIGGRPAHLASAAFHAIGWRFKLFTVQDGGSYSVALQLRDSRTPLPVDFFIVGGPTGTAESRVQSVCTSHIFGRARETRTSTPTLIAEGEAATAMAELDCLVLRIGIADKRTGRLSRDFQGMPSSSGGGGLPPFDGDGPEDSDPEDDDPDGWDSEGFSDDGSMSGPPPMFPPPYMGGGGGGRGRY